ncbi:hypothetical protein [Scytonema sp. PCC 10023]|uniref:hypothetical protein n=1 Tax=Scytonema sp. PCC 10023 TaxID=1680591 RepID=UPI0039C6305F
MKLDAVSSVVWAVFGNFTPIPLLLWGCGDAPKRSRFAIACKSLANQNERDLPNASACALRLGSSEAIAAFPSTPLVIGLRYSLGF